MNDQDLMRNAVRFRQSLVDIGITNDDISKAKAHLIPLSTSQIEEHARLYELLNISYIIRARHLENSHAAETYETVMTLYLKAIPKLAPRER